MSWLVCTIQEWQTLLASLIALLAAYWTITKISKQIRLQEGQIKSERERYEDAQKSKAWATKAALPDALSSLCSFVEACVIFLMSDRQNRELPAPPSDAMNVLKSSVEYIDPISAQKLFEIIVFYQIHNSRFYGYKDQSGEHIKLQRLYDAVKLRALIDHVYEYARKEVDTIPDLELKNSNMKTALKTCASLDYYFQNESRFLPVLHIIDQKHPASDNT